MPIAPALARHPIATAALALLVGAAALSAIGMRAPTPQGMPNTTPAAHAADAGNATLVTAGHAVYVQSCAPCHGRRLQGQPLWQVVDAESWRRAPALDATGHSWLRSDEDLFQTIASGRLPKQATTAPSGMPAFRGRLTDADIVSVVAFVKSHWPTALAIVQAGLNPPGDRPGAKDAGKAWTFPVFCRPGL